MHLMSVHWCKNHMHLGGNFSNYHDASVAVLTIRLSCYYYYFCNLNCEVPSNYKTKLKVGKYKTIFTIRNNNKPAYKTPMTNCMIPVKSVSNTANVTSP